MILCTVVDLFMFYLLETSLFNRLVIFMKKETQLAKLAIAVWLWLEDLGHRELIRVIFASADDFIEALFNETILCITCITPHSPPPTGSNDTPTLTSLLNLPINSKFFHYNGFFAQRGIQRIMDEVCSRIFPDTTLFQELLVSELVFQSHVVPMNNPGNELMGEASSMELGSSSTAAEAPSVLKIDENSVKQAQFRSALNPMARSFNPFVMTTQEQRTLFLTFSHGLPITQEDVFEFFTSQWGTVVENVDVETTSPEISPQYGRAVMKFVPIIQVILNGQQVGRFVFKGRSIWISVYVPKTC